MLKQVFVLLIFTAALGYGNISEESNLVDESSSPNETEFFVQDDLIPKPTTNTKCREFRGYRRCCRYSNSGEKIKCWVEYDL